MSGPYVPSYLDILAHFGHWGMIVNKTTLKSNLSQKLIDARLSLGISLCRLLMWEAHVLFVLKIN